MLRNIIGVAFDWRGASAPAIAKLAIAADELGYDYFWIPEAWGTDALVISAHVLDLTRKIKVGTAILNVYSRSAALIGMSSVTLMQLAPRRFVLGLGSSGKALVENWHGMPYDSPLERTREYVQVIRKVIGGKQVDYVGKVLKLGRFRAFTEIPPGEGFQMYLGALGDKNLKLAGEICDGAIVTLYPKSRLDRAFELLKSAAVPNNSKKTLFCMLPTKIIGDEEEQEEAFRAKLGIKKLIAFYISSMGDYYARLLEASGFGETVKIVRDLYRGGNKLTAVEAINEKLLDELCLIGTANEIESKLGALPNDVVPVFSFRISNPNELEESLSTLRALASKT